MSNQKRGLTEEELKMMEEMDALFAEMRKHPEITSQPFPERMDEEIWRDIRAYEAEKAKEVENAKEAENAEKKADVPRLTAEEAELIQHGKIYKKRKKNRKFYVLIAALIGVMLFGMTSIGGAEKGFERFRFNLRNRDQQHINSDEGVELDTKASEEEIYQQIEDEYGFWPARMTYMPEGIEFVEATIFEEIQTIELLYRGVEGGNISYQIKVDYRDGSIATDNEDQVVEEYAFELQESSAIVKGFYIPEHDKTRWMAEFSDENAQYFIKASGIEKGDFEEILKNLYFF